MIISFNYNFDAPFLRYIYAEISGFPFRHIRNVLNSRLVKKKIGKINDVLVYIGYDAT